MDWMHGKAVDGRVQYAPTKGAEGYFPIEDIMPAYPEGKIAVADYWENRDGKCVCVYKLVDAPKVYRKFSKLKIYGAISGLDATNSAATWATVQTWLEGKTVNGMNGWLAFQLAQEISEDHPLFAAWSEEARVLLGLTEEQFETLLAACVLDN